MQIVIRCYSLVQTNRSEQVGESAIKYNCAVKKKKDDAKSFISLLYEGKLSEDEVFHFMDYQILYLVCNPIL